MNFLSKNMEPYVLITVFTEVIMQWLISSCSSKSLTYFLSLLPLFSFSLHLSFVAQGEAAIQRPMAPAGSQMCGRMTCWPGGLPAVKQEAPSLSTSSFQTEPTPAATSRPRGENHTPRRESSGGNNGHINTIDNSNVNEMHDLKNCKI